MEERGVAVGLEKKGGGRKEELGFVLYRLITAGSKYEPLVILIIIAGSCYKPAVICSQDITNGS